MFRKILFIILILIISINIPATVFFPDEVKENNILNSKLITTITAQGQKVQAIALEYEDDILSGNELESLYNVQVFLDGKNIGERHILSAYSMDKPEISPNAKTGKYIIILLDLKDKNANLYEIIQKNKQPIVIHYKDKQQKIIEKEIVQSNKIPKFYNNRLQYKVTQSGLLKLENGKTLSPIEISISAEKSNIINPLIDDFKPNEIFLENENNKLSYQLYIPKVKTQNLYPLTIFLHGSGQVGKDSIAQLLSSKGAISTLNYEQGFVLAPQYNSVFDPFDNPAQGKKGGIHWQTENRRRLLLKMIDDTLTRYPQINHNRIYIIGLSRGAEGGLYLLLDRPNFFAGALLMSGREAYTIEYVNGNATVENMRNLSHTPIWFFHSKEDKISPVEGSRINYRILKEQLNNPLVKYTELSFNKKGDNGILNNNPHNTWDLVFNSPKAMLWLLKQNLDKK